MGSAKINFAQLESSLQKNQKFQKSGGMVQDGSLLNKNLKGNYTSDNISSYSLNRINKAQRQEELKNVLKETMSLTTKLKDQLKILEKNGVCGTNMK